MAFCIALSGPPELTAQRDEALARLNDLSGYLEQLTRRVSPAVVAIMATGYAPLPQTRLKELMTGLEIQRSVLLGDGRLELLLAVNAATPSPQSRS